MKELITRRIAFEGKRYWVSSQSASMYEDKWSNCLYLHFVKEEYPLIKSPSLIDCDWGRQKQRFNYSESVLNDIDFHGGITFYEESQCLESGTTVVKVGCDFQHLFDDEYMRRDNGKMLLEIHGPKIVQEFEQLYERLQKLTPTPEESR